jgi:four helix bundle protein
MGDYRSLHVWKMAHELTLGVYRVTSSFPASERFGLVDQMRRAASSVPTNLAEGCGRNTDAELARFCRIALGSANELEYQLLLARDLQFLAEKEHDRLAERVREVRRMLAVLIARLRPGVRS